MAMSDNIGLPIFDIVARAKNGKIWSPFWAGVVRDQTGHSAKEISGLAIDPDRMAVSADLLDAMNAKVRAMDDVELYYVALKLVPNGAARLPDSMGVHVMPGAMTSNEFPDFVKTETGYAPSCFCELEPVSFG